MRPTKAATTAYLAMHHRGRQMPADQNKNTLARQWDMLKLLPARGPGLTAREIAERLAGEGYEVSKRTVERDLLALSGIFPITCNDKSAPFGWHFAPGSRLDLSALTISEALTLKLVEQYLTPLLPSTMLSSLAVHFEHAERLLDAMAEANPAARWTEKIRSVMPSQPFVSPDIDSEVLAALQDALLHDRQIEVTYRKPGVESPITLALHPLALLQRGPVTYLAATAFTYTDVRLYAMHRVQMVTELGLPAQRPVNFDLEDYVRQGGANFGSGQQIRLRLRVHPDLATNLTEAPLAPDMTLVRGEDGIIAEVTLPDTWQLHWWLLSQAERVEVLEPAMLREKIRERLRAALAHYTQFSVETAPV